jgi:hypothetical protein
MEETKLDRFLREKDLGRWFSFEGNKMANGEEEKTMPVYTKVAKSNVDGCWEGWRGVLGFVWHESEITLFAQNSKDAYTPMSTSCIWCVPALHISTWISRRVAQPWSWSHHRRRGWWSHGSAPATTTSSASAPAASSSCHSRNGKVGVC